MEGPFCLQFIFSLFFYRVRADDWAFHCLVIKLRNWYDKIRFFPSSFGNIMANICSSWGGEDKGQTPPQCRPDLPGPGLLGQWGRMLLILVFVKFRTKQPLQYINWHKISKSATLKLSFFWFSKSKQKRTKWHF